MYLCSRSCNGYYNYIVTITAAGYLFCMQHCVLFAGFQWAAGRQVETLLTATRN